MQQPERHGWKRRSEGYTWAVVSGAALLLLVVILIIVVSAWGAEMSTHGIVAMILGATLTVGLGVGLMALIFYSSRHGYDERGGGPPGNPPANDLEKRTPESDEVAKSQ